MDNIRVVLLFVGPPAILTYIVWKGLEKWKKWDDKRVAKKS